MAEKNLSREFISDFIQIYKSEPCLWKIKSAEYSDRDKKNTAYEKLINKLKEVDKEVNKDSVVKKINNLRSSFRKERKKVLESIKSGASADDVYHPTIWYYNDLLFLGDQDTPRTSVSNMEKVDLFDESSIEMLDSPSQDSQQSDAATKTGVKRKKIADDPASQLLGIVKQKLEANESPHHIFGNHVANELDKLPNTMQILAQKFINDVLFEAQMGTLNRYSKLVTSPTSKTSTALSRYFGELNDTDDES